MNLVVAELTPAVLEQLIPALRDASIWQVLLTFIAHRDAGSGQHTSTIRLLHAGTLYAVWVDREDGRATRGPAADSIAAAIAAVRWEDL